MMSVSRCSLRKCSTQGGGGILASSSSLLRCFSSVSSPSPFSASNLKILKKPGESSPLPPLNTLTFGGFYSDHMLVADWTRDSGWGPPVIKPLSYMSIHPGNSSIQYGISCFDGIKAFKLESGEPAIFRGDLNAQRFLDTSERMGFPSFDPEELMTCMKALVKVDANQIPDETGFSMYLRPTMMSLQPSLGVTVADTARMYVIMSPVGPYFKQGFKPISLLADTKHVRAWEGGMGKYKAGSNYAPTVMPQREAAMDKGYSSILWLYPSKEGGGEDYEITEIGTMNFMIHWKNPKTGKEELVTPPLGDLILPGVTRDSVLQLAREIPSLDVKEEKIMMSTLINALKDKQVIEIFGTGTAALVLPVNKIGYKGVDYDIPMNEEKEGEGIGKLGKQMLQEIQRIQYGKVQHKWAIKC